MVERAPREAVTGQTFATRISILVVAAAGRKFRINRRGGASLELDEHAAALPCGLISCRIASRRWVWHWLGGWVPYGGYEVVCEEHDWDPNYSQNETGLQVGEGDVATRKTHCALYQGQGSRE
jgi:hypothetical protein